MPGEDCHYPAAKIVGYSRADRRQGLHVEVARDLQSFLQALGTALIALAVPDKRVDF